MSLLLKKTLWKFKLCPQVHAFKVIKNSRCRALVVDKSFMFVQGRTIRECIYENACRRSEVLEVFKDRRHFWFPVCTRRKLYLSCPFSEETATSIVVRVLSSASQRSHVTSCSWRHFSWNSVSLSDSACIRQWSPQRLSLVIWSL